MNKTSEILIPNNYYHIYNRGISDNKIFFNDENYIYFLKKYDEYLSNYIDTFAYCLLPNHFHLLIRVKELISLNSDATDNSILYIDKNILSEQFRRFFLSYSKAINKQENRKGSLFIKNYKRKLITSEEYFSILIFYIHYNPVHHKINNDLTSYKWSSYRNVIGNQKTKLSRKEVLDIFGGRINFIKFHTDLQYVRKINILENDD